MSKFKTPEKDSKLGVDKVCFGIFKCPTCHRDWESTKTWKDFGQKCKNCETFAKPAALEPLHFYMCQPCVKATEGCAGVWQFKYCSSGTPCPLCKLLVMPALTYSDPPVAVRTDLDHKEDLCEKCISLGKACYKPDTDKPDGDGDEKAETTEKLPFFKRIFSFVRRRGPRPAAKATTDSEKKEGAVSTRGYRGISNLRGAEESQMLRWTEREPVRSPEEIVTAKFENYILLFILLLSFTFPMFIDWIKMEIREWNTPDYYYK